jgi:hypothetical protein
MTATVPSFAIDVHGDIVEITYRGPFEHAYATQTFARVADVLARERRAFLLVDGAGGVTTPEARGYISEWFKANPGVVAAIYGAGVATRAIAEMILRAVNLLNPGRLKVGFHRTRDESIAWIDTLRGQS